MRRSSRHLFQPPPPASPSARYWLLKQRGEDGPASPLSRRPLAESKRFVDPMPTKCLSDRGANVQRTQRQPEPKPRAALSAREGRSRDGKENARGSDNQVFSSLSFTQLHPCPRFFQPPHPPLHPPALSCPLPPHRFLPTDPHALVAAPRLLKPGERCIAEPTLGVPQAEIRQIMKPPASPAIKRTQDQHAKLSHSPQVPFHLIMNITGTFRFMNHRSRSYFA